MLGEMSGHSWLKVSIVGGTKHRFSGHPQVWSANCYISVMALLKQTIYHVKSGIFLQMVNIQFGSVQKILKMVKDL